MTANDIAERLTDTERAPAAASAHAAHLQGALASNRQIGMAMGILMERHKLTQEQAFDQVRDQRSNVMLCDVAEQVI